MQWKFQVECNAKPGPSSNELTVINLLIILMYPLTLKIILHFKIAKCLFILEKVANNYSDK